MIVKAIKTRIFREGEDLALFIGEHIRSLKNGSVVAITSKIVALAERRTAPVSKRASVVRSESDALFKTKHVDLTLKDGMFMANAGVDDSNGNGKLILLPKDSFLAADLIRRELMKAFKVKKLGIVITDSRVAPLRAGVTGVAIGYAGFRGVMDYRGKKDIFGRRFKYTKVNVADGLAGAATSLMGEGAEKKPLAIIEEAPVEFTEKINRKEILIPPDEDMYRPLFGRLLKKSSKRRK